MARTTLTLADDLLKQLKRKAAEEGSSFREIVNRVIRRGLQEPKSAVEYRLQWKTHKGKILPGVNLDNRSGLYEIMGGR